MNPCGNDVPRLLLAEAAGLTGLHKGRIYVQDGASEGLRLGATLGCGTATPRWPHLIARDSEVDGTLSGKAVARLCPGDLAFATLQPHSKRGLLVMALRSAERSTAGLIVFDDDAGVEIDHAMLAFAAVAGTAATAWLESRRSVERLEELTQRSRSLQAGTSVERALSRLVGGPEGAAAMVALAAELTGKVVAVYGENHRLVASAGMPARAKVSLPSPVALLAAAGGQIVDGPVEVASRPLAGLPRRHLVAPVLLDDEHRGLLVMLEHPSAFRPFDQLVVRLAAHYIARELGVQRRVADVAWNARASLARQLVNGSNDLDDLRTSGEYLGVKTDAPRVLVYAVGQAVHDVTSADLQGLGEQLQDTLGLEVLVTRGSEGVMLLVEAPAQVPPVESVASVKAALRQLGAAGAARLTAGVSSVCEPRGLARAYREAREVAHCIDRFVPPTATRILAVDDLGPARLFVANSAMAAVRAYVDDVLGALLTGEAGSADLVATLGRYFDSGRSVRLSAAQLGVHENTVRLRLARISAATGLDVAADANDQLSAQTALLVLRLQGHPALPSFDDAAAAAACTA